MEAQWLTEVLRATAGDVSEAARRLGVSYTAIARRISRHREIMPDPSTYGGEWTKRGRGRPRTPPKPPRSRASVPCKVTDDALRAALVAAEGRVRAAAALDGLRAVAILAVLVCHAAGALGGWWSTSVALWESQGSLGVDLFFVLSGYLITTGLLRAHGQRGALAAFWRRRAAALVAAGVPGARVGRRGVGARVGADSVRRAVDYRHR